MKESYFRHYNESGQFKNKCVITALYAAEEQLTQNPDQEELQRKTQKLKKDIEPKELLIARGAQIRSRVRWIEEGEKNNKIFLELRKAERVKQHHIKPQNQSTKHRRSKRDPSRN